MPSENPSRTEETKQGYLIDMDGVIYRGSDPIPGAVELIRHLRENDIPFLFLTNNSQRTRRDIVTRLRKMRFDVEEKHVFTSAIATAHFVARQKPNGTAYVIGEGGLLTALHHQSYAIVDSDPDYVILGEGRAITLEMIETAVKMILRGAKLIATNLDPNCPTRDGLRPGCGAFVKLLETATGVKAFGVGKPSPVMFREARKELNLRTSETTMIGDTIETDILGGVQMGYRTILVLSGGTRREDLAQYAIQPDLVINSIADLLTLEKKRIRAEKSFARADNSTEESQKAKKRVTRAQATSPSGFSDKQSGRSCPILQS